MTIFGAVAESGVASPYLVALIGLAGVLVGALTSGLLSYCFERLRERDEIYRAKRLVAEELQTIWTHCDAILEARRAPLAMSDEKRARFLPTVAWEQHKAVLASKRAVRDDEWVALSATLHATDTLRLAVLERSPGSQLPPDTIEHARTHVALAASLYESLTGRRVDGSGPK